MNLRSFIQNLNHFAKSSFAQAAENLIPVLDDVSLLVDQVTILIILSGSASL